MPDLPRNRFDLTGYAHALFMHDKPDLDIIGYCSECDKPLYAKAYPCQTCRDCFSRLDGPYDEKDEGDLPLE